ncbi:MAG: hypothetical protein NT062_14410 [Proteobacteria bacterium]|nr:hypothetical protein [Pseudomonadota bacterium]
MRLALASVFLIGCWSTTPAPVTPVAPRLAPAGPDLAATIADPLGFLPVDGGFVVRLDAERLRGGALWNRFGAALVARIAEDEGQDACRTAVLDSLQSLSIGLRSVSPLRGVAVVRGVTRATVEGCLHAQPNVRARAVVTGTTTVWHAEDFELGLRFVDDRTLVLVMDEAVVPAMVDRVVQAGAPLRRSAGFQAVLELLDQQRVAWIVIGPNDPVLELLAVIGARPRTVFGSLDARDFAAGELHVRFDDDPTADRVATDLRGRIGMINGFVDRLEVTHVERDVVVEVSASEAQLVQVLSLAGLAVTP